MKTIRQLREERGWSQELLASYLRVTQGAISQWELGRTVPRPELQQRLADLFGVSWGEIAFRPGEQTSQERP